jgi:hypothetical protein
MSSFQGQYVVLAHLDHFDDLLFVSNAVHNLIDAGPYSFILKSARITKWSQGVDNLLGCQESFAQALLFQSLFL